MTTPQLHDPPAGDAGPRSFDLVIVGGGSGDPPEAQDTDQGHEDAHHHGHQPHQGDVTG